MASKWGEDTTLKFVKEYKIHDCLWNKKNIDYKSKQAREASYKKLMNTMNIPGFCIPEVKTKIRNLRSTYSQELKKIRNSKQSGGDHVYKPHIKWFKEMKGFLQVTERSTQNHIIVNSDEDEVNTEDSIIDELDLKDHKFFEAQLSPNNSNMTISENFSRPAKRRKPELKDLKAINCEFGRMSSDDEENENFYPSTKQRKLELKDLKTIKCETSRISSDEENEFLIFSKHVAVQLQKMSAENALMAQERIQSVLSSFRLQEIREKSFNQSNENTVPVSTTSSTKWTEHSTFRFEEC